MRERTVSKVVEQRRGFEDRAYVLNGADADRTLYGLTVVLEQGGEHPSRQVHRSDRMRESRVDRAWEDEMKKAGLADVTQTLEHRRIDDRRLHGTSTDVLVNGVAEHEHPIKSRRGCISSTRRPSRGPNAA